MRRKRSRSGQHLSVAHERSRVEAEAVRDSLLAIAGKLDPTMGGPEIEETKAEEVYRRSIYFRTAPDLQVEMLKVFDVASPNECFQTE